MCERAFQIFGTCNAGQLLLVSIRSGLLERAKSLPALVFSTELFAHLRYKGQICLQIALMKAQETLVSQG